MKKKNSARKGFTLIEAILVAILVGLLASIGIIKAADAKQTVADNVLDSAVQDVNMQIQRHVIDGEPLIAYSGTDAELLAGAAAALAGTTGADWNIVLGSSVANGYMTTTSASNLAALLDASGVPAGKASEALVTVGSSGSTLEALEFYLN